MGVRPLGCLRASSRPRGPEQWQPWGRSLYLDVSMFSSLKLLQCSITLLETVGERGSEGGLGSGGPGSPRQMRPLDLLANVSSDADADGGGVLGGGGLAGRLAHAECPGNGTCGHQYYWPPCSLPSSLAPPSLPLSPRASLVRGSPESAQA